MKRRPLSELHKKKISTANMGRVPWNKGIKIPEMYGNTYSFLGDKAKNNAFHRRAQILMKHIDRCQRCLEKKVSFQLVVHHQDENPRNNKMNNLEKICRKCHINHHRSKLIEAKKL